MLSEPGSRSAGLFAERIGMRYLDFAAEPVDRFANVNTPEELARVRENDRPI
jgi:molybdopterin-guanine dinucleotide biosynthesis protein A